MVDTCSTGQNLQQTHEIEGQVLMCPRQAFFDPPGVGATHFKHVLWRIVDEEANHWNLDLASAQFGHHKPLTSVRSYEEVIKFHVTRSSNFGFERAGGEDGHNGCGGDPTKMISQELCLAHGVFMAKKLKDWELRYMEFAKVLQLSKPAFEKMRSDIMETARRAIATSFEDFHKKVLVRRHGCSLIRDHDWTRAGIHPYQGQHYEQDLVVNMAPLKAKLDAMRLAVDFRMKQYQELDEEERKAVDGKLSKLGGETVHKDSHFTVSRGVFVHMRGKPVTIKLV
jgi:hypothetical protein